MIKNYKNAFKSYDIRWIYWTEIDNLFSYTMWKAIWKYIQKEHWQNANFSISSDVRKNNIWLIEYFIQWMLETWFKNITIIKIWKNNEYKFWICSTPISYFISNWLFNLSVVFTASHNPWEYVWMKFFDSNTTFLSKDFLIKIFNETFSEKIKLPKKTNIINSIKSISFLNKIEKLEKILLKKFSSLKFNHQFCVDFSNWSWISFEKNFFSKINNTIFFLNDKPDWEFKSHLSDTSDTENYTQLKNKIIETNSDFWIMFDWDADRLWFVDWKWNIIQWDIIYSILINQIVKNKNTIIYEVMSTKRIKEITTEKWWNAILWKMWRFFIKENMDKNNAILWWESSWHFMFKEIWWYEMPLLALYYIIKEIEENDNNIEKMLKKYIKYYKTPVISQKVKNKDLILEKIKKEFQNYEQKYIDWISIFWNNFWFNVRGSNTENKIRYTIEWEENTVNKIKAKLENIIS